MAGEGTKRIIDLTEAAETQSGDYIAIDSTGRGTRKLPAGFMATAEDLSAEETARQTADATLDGKITAEAQARLDADNALGDQITALDEKTEADAALIQNPTKTLSGALVSFTDGAEMPMVACTAEIVPKQSGTGTPSPENVRPISGWESVNVTDAGVNVWDEEWRNGYYGSNGVFYATPSATSNLANTNPISVKPSTAYYFKAPNTNGNTVCWYDANMTLISANTNTSFNTVITSPSNARYLNFKANYTGVTVSSYNHDISINYPSTGTDYHAYTGTTTTVNLGRTVYGGTLDVVSGVLTVSHAKEEFDGTQGSWQVYNGAFYRSFTGYKRGSYGLKNAISDKFVNSGQNGGIQNLIDSGRGHFALRADTENIQFYLLDATITTSDEFNTWLASNNVTVVYELATPQTYQLTPTEVKTLLGENHVWADSGDIEITYRRDISIVINNLESALNG